jgi:hypothetical protein
MNKKRLAIKRYEGFKARLSYYIVDCATLTETMVRIDKKEKLNYLERLGAINIPFDESPKSVARQLVDSIRSSHYRAFNKESLKEMEISASRLFDLDLETNHTVFAGQVEPLKPYFDERMQIGTIPLMEKISIILTDVMNVKQVLDSYFAYDEDQDEILYDTLMEQVEAACFVAAQSLEATKGYLTAKAERSLSNSKGAEIQAEKSKNRIIEFTKKLKEKGTATENSIYISKRDMQKIFTAIEIYSYPTQKKYIKAAESTLKKDLKMAQKV